MWLHQTPSEAKIEAKIFMRVEKQMRHEDKVFTDHDTYMYMWLPCRVALCHSLDER